MDLIKDSLSNTVMYIAQSLNWTSKLCIVVPMPDDILCILKPYLLCDTDVDVIRITFRSVRRGFSTAQWDWIMSTPYFCCDSWRGEKIGLEQNSKVETQFLFKKIQWYHNIYNSI